MLLPQRLSGQQHRLASKLLIRELRQPPGPLAGGELLLPSGAPLGHSSTDQLGHVPHLARLVPHLVEERLERTLGTEPELDVPPVPAAVGQRLRGALLLPEQDGGRRRGLHPADDHRENRLQTVVERCLDPSTPSGRLPLVQAGERTGRRRKRGTGTGHGEIPEDRPGTVAAYLREHAGPGMDQELEVWNHAHRVVAGPHPYVDEAVVHAAQHAVGETAPFEVAFDPVRKSTSASAARSAIVRAGPGPALLIDLDDLLAAIPHAGELHSRVERRAGAPTAPEPHPRPGRASGHPEGWTPSPPRSHSRRARPPRPGCRSTASPSPLSSCFPRTVLASRKVLSIRVAIARSRAGKASRRGCSPTSKQHPAAG